ncbi:MAG: hypothetical protein LAO30_17430 [Acidobacteriia bacterium]|nr:hypothetical protein [Terriglobia bacterium]
MVKVVRAFVLLSCGLLAGVGAASAQNTGYNPNFTGTGNGCVAGGTCYYIDYSSGSDANSGTSKTSPWKSVPGMTCATGNAAAHSFKQTDEFIMKGGVTWPFACISGEWDITSGGAGTPNSYAYPGIYLGYDPTWNAGIVNSVRVTDPGVCAAGSTLSVSFSGGGGSNAAAKANVETPDTVASLSILSFVTMTNQGSGYTSNPAVSFAVTSGSCSKLPTAYADIYSPVISGAGGVMGTASSIPRMATFSAAYMTVDHLEFAHDHVYSNSDYSWGGTPNMLGTFGNHVTLQNLYVHDFSLSSVSGFNTGCQVNGGAACNLDIAQTAALYGGGTSNPGLTLNNSIFNNYESEAGGCAAAAGYSGKCVQMTAIFTMAATTNNIINNWRGGIYTVDNASNYLVAGNKMWAMLHDVGTQHGDAFYLHAGGLLYNNVLRDIFPGTAAFYIETGDGSSPTAVGNQMYIFNNVVWNIGTSTPPIGYSSEFYSNSATSVSPRPDLRAWNNTFYSYQGTSDCVGAGQWYGASPTLQSSMNFTKYNNHCMSTQGSVHWYDSNDQAHCGAPNGCGVWNNHSQPNAVSTQDLIDPLNVIVPPTLAASQGYSPSNNYAPTASSNDTVAFAGNANSQNLTNLCSSNLNGLSLSALCFDILGNPRPATGGWQAGAYVFGASGSGPQAPTGLMATVH